MIEVPPPRVRTIRDPEALQALSHPTRVRMLEILREPGSAAAVGRAMRQPRQRINHHLKTLEAAGLVERVGTRRRGNFMETLFRASARSYVVSPEVAWADPRRLEALRQQHSLQTLVAVGEQLQRDAVGLLDRVAFDEAGGSREVPSATVCAETRFADDAARAAFLREYVAAVRDLLERHGSDAGEPYRVVLAAHPIASDEPDEDAPGCEDEPRVN